MVISVKILPRVSLKMRYTEKKIYILRHLPELCTTSDYRKDYKILSELHMKDCNTPIWINTKFPHKRLIFRTPMLCLKHLWCCVIIWQCRISVCHHWKSARVYFQNTLGTKIVLPASLSNAHNFSVVGCLLKIWRTLKDTLDIVYLYIYRWAALP
jgi:hypothetical protein